MGEKRTLKTQGRTGVAGTPRQPEAAFRAAARKALPFPKLKNIPSRGPTEKEKNELIPTQKEIDCLDREDVYSLATVMRSCSKWKMFFNNIFRKLLDRIHTKVSEFRVPRKSEPPLNRVFINLQLANHPNIQPLQRLMGKAKISPGKISKEDVHSLKKLYMGVLPSERDRLLDQQIYIALTTICRYGDNLEVRKTALEVLDSVPDGRGLSFEPIASLPELGSPPEGDITILL